MAGRREYGAAPSVPGCLRDRTCGGAGGRRVPDLDIPPRDGGGQAADAHPGRGRRGLCRRDHARSPFFRRGRHRPRPSRPCRGRGPRRPAVGARVREERQRHRDPRAGRSLEGSRDPLLHRSGRQPRIRHGQRPAGPRARLLGAIRPRRGLGPYERPRGLAGPAARRLRRGPGSVRRAHRARRPGARPGRAADRAGPGLARGAGRRLERRALCRRVEGHRGGEQLGHPHRRRDACRRTAGGLHRGPFGHRPDRPMESGAGVQRDRHRAGGLDRRTRWLSGHLRPARGRRRPAAGNLRLPHLRRVQRAGLRRRRLGRHELRRRMAGSALPDRLERGQHLRRAREPVRPGARHQRHPPVRRVGPVRLAGTARRFVGHRRLSGRVDRQPERGHDQPMGRVRRPAPGIRPGARVQHLPGVRRDEQPDAARRDLGRHQSPRDLD